MKTLKFGLIIWKNYPVKLEVMGSEMTNEQFLIQDLNSLNNGYESTNDAYGEADLVTK